MRDVYVKKRLGVSNRDAEDASNRPPNFMAFVARCLVLLLLVAVVAAVVVVIII